MSSKCRCTRWGFLTAVVGGFVAVCGGCANNSGNPGFDDGGATTSSSGSPSFGSDSGNTSTGGSGSSSGFGNPGSGSSSGFGSSGSGSSSGFSGSGSGSSSGFGGSGSGSSSGFGGSSGSSGSGSGSAASTDAGPCGATTTGGIMLGQGGYFAVPSATIGMGGYAYAFSDATGMPAGMSSACIAGSAFCGMGTTGVQSTATWGAGIGLNLNQAMATSSTSPPIDAFQATGSGISYALSGLSSGARLIIDNSPNYPTVVDYCAAISNASGTLPWSMFNTKCWDNSGTALTAAPAMAHHVQVQVYATSMAGSFNFCVTSLKFM